MRQPSFTTYAPELSSEPLLSRFELDSADYLLGIGSFGKVYRVKCRASGLTFALKVLYKQQFEARDLLNVLLTEISLHSAMQDQHVISLVDSFEDEEHVFMVLEYASQGSLYEVLRHRRLTEREARGYFLQVCRGVRYLHDNEVIHRDLKPENLLIMQDGTLKICDFGWSFKGSQTRDTFCGTIDYMAPEMLQRQGHSYEVDVWALGILLFEMLQGKVPGPDLSFEGEVSSEAQDLISKLLQKHPSDRLSLREVMAHDWVNDHRSSGCLKPHYQASALDSTWDSKYEAERLAIEEQSSDFYAAVERTWFVDATHEVVRAVPLIKEDEGLPHAPRTHEFIVPLDWSDFSRSSRKRIRQPPKTTFWSWVGSIFGCSTR